MPGGGGGAQNSNWEGADFTNAVVDRVSFDGSSMKVRWEKRQS